MSPHHGKGVMALIPENEKLGATGEFPDGKVNRDDEGEVRFAVGSDTEKKIVFVDFGKVVKWVAMPPKAARELAQILLEQAARAEGN